MLRSTRLLSARGQRVRPAAFATTLLVALLVPRANGSQTVIHTSHLPDLVRANDLHGMLAGREVAAYESEERTGDTRGLGPVVRHKGILINAGSVVCQDRGTGPAVRWVSDDVACHRFEDASPRRVLIGPRDDAGLRPPAALQMGQVGSGLHGLFHRPEHGRLVDAWDATLDGHNVVVVKWKYGLPAPNGRTVRVDQEVTFDRDAGYLPVRAVSRADGIRANRGLVEEETRVLRSRTYSVGGTDVPVATEWTTRRTVDGFVLQDTRVRMVELTTDRTVPADLENTTLRPDDVVTRLPLPPRLPPPSVPAPVVQGNRIAGQSVPVRWDAHVLAVEAALAGVGLLGVGWVTRLFYRHASADKQTGERTEHRSEPGV